MGIGGRRRFGQVKSQKEAYLDWGKILLPNSRAIFVYVPGFLSMVMVVSESCAKNGSMRVTVFRSEVLYFWSGVGPPPRATLENLSQYDIQPCARIAPQDL